MLHIRGLAYNFGQERTHLSFEGCSVKNLKTKVKGLFTMTMTIEKF